MEISWKIKNVKVVKCISQKMWATLGKPVFTKSVTYSQPSPHFMRPTHKQLPK